MNEIDISFFAHEEIDEIARLLLEKVNSGGDWEWKLDQEEGDRHSGIGASAQISGKSEKHDLGIMMYIVQPWTTRWKLHYTKDGKEYICLEKTFEEVTGLKELEKRLTSIAKGVYKEEERRKKQEAGKAKQEWEEEKKRKAGEAVELLKE